MEQKDITPDDVNPVDITEYPKAIETCEIAVSARKKTIAALKRLIQGVEDDYARDVANETVVTRKGKELVERRKYTSAEEREREVRFRCQTEHEKYMSWVNRLYREEELLAGWQAKFNKLRRELRLLEHEYVTTGQRVFQQHTGRTFDTGGENI